VETPCIIDSSARVAVVHDWISSMAGGERVLEDVCEVFPQADIFCLVVDRARLSDGLRRHRIRTSFLRRIPGSTRHYRGLLPLFPLAVEQFDLRAYDLVISSDSACVKGVLAPSRAMHVCYCHTPMRYAWDLYHDYMERVRAGPLRRGLMRLFLHYVRLFDFSAAQRVDGFIANSRCVARRIEAAYRRRSVVVHPPVRTEHFVPRPGAPGEFDLIVSRLVGYKRIELAVEAYRADAGRLVVIGEGPELSRLRRRASPAIEFRGAVSDADVLEAMQRCRLFLLPGVEDFGIAAVEAQACGRPVVAFGEGGALETVVPGVTGLFFREPTPESLAEAVRRAAGTRFDPRTIRGHAERFSRQRFRREFADALGRMGEEHAARLRAAGTAGP
jgi:glycosyltransferase involved in cell wall biosynthesis